MKSADEAREIRASGSTQAVFLLSPASCRGRRAELIFRPEADFPLAQRVRSAPGASVGEVFTFLSGLYFRGKIAYAQAFGRRDAGPAALVITPSRGLIPAAREVTLEDLREYREVDLHADEPRYRTPLARDAAALAGELRSGDRVVLLGSIATGKYVDVLLEHLAERLFFPREFVGRGDMSRGGLMLRCAEDGRELTYVTVVGAVRRGPRPPRLEPRR